MSVFQQFLNTLIQGSAFLLHRWGKLTLRLLPWIALVLLITLTPAMTALAAPATQEFQKSVGGPTGNGPSIASQSVTMRRNADNPTGTTFTAATDPVTVTLSLSNFQHSTTVYSTGRAMNFGALAGSTSTAIYATLNGIGSPADSMFSSLTSTIGQGISVTQNGAIQLYLDTRPLNGTVATSTRNYYGDLTVSFSRPLTNPMLHFSGLGGAVGTLGLTAELDLDTTASPSVTLSKVSGTTNFTVTATQILNTATNPSASCTNAVGACGSVLATGNALSSLKFKVYLRGDGAGTSWVATSGYGGDAFYFAGVSALDEYDYGDAPALYGTPSHTIVSGINLGATAPDSETAAQPNTAATGDDTTGTDDEDGVTFPTLTQGATASVSVSVTQASANSGYLQGWIDWNGDGDFADSGEQIATNLQYSAGTSGTLSVPVTVPAGATTSQTYARFRWSTTSGLNSSTTAASDGEVEDYALTVQAAPVSSNDVMAYANSGTGAYKNEIAWLNWSNSSLADGIQEGDSVTFPLACGSGQLTATFSAVAPLVAAANYRPTDMATWSGASLHQAYNTANPGEALYFTGSDTVPDAADVSFTINFSMTVGGSSVTPDLIMVDAEATNAGVNNEHIYGQTNGGAWSIIENAIGSDYTISGIGTNSFHLSKTEVPSNSPVLLTENATQLTVTIDTNIGLQGVAFGVLLPCDRGDAPGYGDPLHSFKMKAANPPGSPASPAALQNVSGQLYLGTAEPDAETVITADDNVQGLRPADEDGITLPTLTQGGTATITATVSGAGGYLQGWIDWNGDGDFLDSGEQVATNIQDNLVGDTNNTAGTIAFNVNVPANAVTTQTFARFRWSTTLGLNSTAAASDGEVEDYALTIAAAATYDYGDAPADLSAIDVSMLPAYPTLIADNGARHTLNGTTFLGAAVTSDSDGQPTVAANGDSDDGVTFPILGSTNVLLVGQPNTLTVTASVAGFLNVWMDENQDGDWDDSGEQLFTNQALSAGANSLSYTPNTTIPHGDTYMRFRFTSASVASPLPTGSLPDGEVEDYRVAIVAPEPGVCSSGLIKGGFEGLSVESPVGLLVGNGLYGVYQENVVPGWAFIASNPGATTAEANAGTAFDARNAIELWKSGFDGVPSYEGNQHAEINAYVYGNLYQDLQTTPGTVINYQFAHRGRSGVDTIDVLLGAPGATSSVTGGSGFTTGNTAWKVYTGSYTVPAGQYITRFSFQALSSAGGVPSYGNFIDAIEFGFLCNDDYSDAPITGTSPNGSGTNNYGEAKHLVVNNYRLGAAIDEDTSSIANANASGDGVDDDGITLPALIQGATATITATVTGTGGYLQGWIDWNGDGDFADSGEQVATNIQDNLVGDTNNTAGTIAFNVNVPANAVTTQTFARFRWSTTLGLNSTTAASDGEVEDYALTIGVLGSYCAAVPVTTLGSAYVNGNNEYILTDDENNKSGFIWSNDKIDLNQPFDIQLGVYLGSNVGINPSTGLDAGADGLSFILQNDPRGTAAQGYTGGFMGVDGDINLSTYGMNDRAVYPSVTVEFDTFDNTFMGFTGDIAADHTAIYLNGDVALPDAANTLKSATSVGTGGEIEDGKYHITRYVWNPTTKNLTYYFDGAQIASVTYDLIPYFGSPYVRFGFAAATGSSKNLQKACWLDAPAMVDPLGAISGTVFQDDDLSNAQNGSEAGLGLITVSLYDDNGTPTNVTDDTLVTSTDTASDGSYTFANLAAGTYRVVVNTADTDLPAGALIGTPYPQTGVTVTAGSTTTVNFGFDIFTCVPGGGTTDGAVTAYISKEVAGGSTASRSEADTLDDSWRAAAGLPSTGTVAPWLGYTARSLNPAEPALFSTYGVAVDVTRINIETTSPCLGTAYTSGAALSTSVTLQDTAPRPASLYDTAAQPAFWTDSGGDSQTPNAVRFTFANPVKSFGAWFGDLETRTDGNARPAYLRLLDASGNRIGHDIPVTPTDLYDGGSTTSVNQNLCGSVTPGTDTACGNQSTRWLGFVDSAASARIKHVVVIVGDDDFGDNAGTELISFIGMDIVQEDFGDAPASYGDAIHWLSVVPQVYLGTTSPDKETQSQHTANGGADGLGDDNNGDDEDGVANFPALNSGDKDYSLNVVVNNRSGSSARLVGWIDFNRNGVFDSNEATSTTVATGANDKTVALTWKTLPTGLQPGASYLRLRLTTDSSIATGTASTSLATGTANNGEVEDYPLTIASSGFTLSGTVYKDLNVNAVNDTEAGIKNVTMVLYDTANGTCRSTRTGADGSYRFSHVPAAAVDNYVVYEAAAENYQTPSQCPPAANDPTGYLSSTANTLWVTVTNADVTGIDFGDVQGPTFELDNQQAILPNSAVAYPHVFTTQADGTVLFSLAGAVANPAGLNWGAQLYRDTNCDAQLDGGDTLISGSLAVNAGDQVCLLAKVVSPANAGAGATHTLSVQSAFSYAGSTGLANDVQTHTDITTVNGNSTPGTPVNPSDPVAGEGKLSLVKSVWNVTRNSDGSVALPGETLLYTIHYQNVGNGSVYELLIQDSIPEFTQLAIGSLDCTTDQPAELPACTPLASGNGGLEWRWAASSALLPGSSGSVSYQVLIE